MVLDTKEINSLDKDTTTTCSKRQQWALSHSPKMREWSDISTATDQEIPEAAKLDLNLLENQLELIISWAVKQYGQEAFKKAKEEFYLLAGKFFYDDTHYNQRVNYFLDYFLFERKMTDHETHTQGEAPYYEFITSEYFALESFDGDNKKKILELRNSRHSIYMVKKATLSELVLVDLLSKDKIKVSPIAGQTFQGLEKGQVFQSYIYEWNGENILSKGIIIHPEQSWKTVLKFCKTQRKMDNIQSVTILMKLAKLQIESKIRKTQLVKKFYETSLF